MHPNNTPLSKLPAIKPGCFLVLHGPQGCGKSRLARRIAEPRGAFVELRLSDITHQPCLADALGMHPSTLIIDEADYPTINQWSSLKQLVSTPTLLIRAPYGHESTRVSIPPIIVCCRDALMFEGSRRAQLHLVEGA